MSKYILVVFLALISVQVRGAERDSIPAPVRRALSQLQSIGSAELKYVLVNRGLMSSQAIRDTITLRCSGLLDPGHFSFVLMQRGQTIVCEDSLVEWVNRDTKSIYYDTILPNQILNRFNHLLFATYLNGGKGLQRYLDSNRATMQYGDTVINGKPLHWLTFINPSDDPADSMIGDPRICYGIDDRGQIVFLRITSIDFHQPMLNGRELLFAKLNQLKPSDIRKEIVSVKQEASRSGFGLQEKSTEAEAQTKLVKVGDSIPNFMGRTPDGDTIEFNSIHSKVLLLDFWYTGCGPCRYALPFLRSMQTKYGPAGLTIVGLDPMDDELPIVRLVLKSEAVTNPELLIGRDISDTMFGVSSYPTLIILDRNKKVQYLTLGYAKSEEAEVEKAIRDALELAKK